MQSNCIKNLLNLKGVIVKSIKNLENIVEVYIEMPKLEQVCPHCGSKTSKVHDYRSQPIKDIPIQFKPTNLIYKKRRYECKNCGKNFYESNEIISKYSRRTTRFTEYVVNELRNLSSCSDIAKKTSISPSVISKMLPYFAVTNTSLPRVLCIDEFKGNAGKFKYQVALINGETHEVVDILECRQKHFLCEYFKKFPKEQLDNVQYFVTDLWETYKDIAFTYFRKAKIIADHFHFARFACNAVNEIRIQVQKIYLKKKEFILSILESFFFLELLTLKLTSKKMNYLIFLLTIQKIFVSLTGKKRICLIYFILMKLLMLN